jgi:hypothetical protein
VNWSVQQLGRDGWEDIAVDGRTGSDGLMPMCLGLTRNAQFEIVATTRDGERRRVQITLTEPTTVFPIIF